MAQHSNFDRRRINGPESSSHPIFEEEVAKIPSNLLRTSRKNDEIRPIFLQLGLISQANGSAYIETEKTKIAVAVLELFPKSQIDVYVHILEVDGIESSVGAGATAASAALADAGIEMLGLAISCTTAVVGKSPEGSLEVFVDPNGEETEAAKGLVTVTCLPALGTVTNVVQSGLISADKAIECMNICIKQCEDIHFVVAQSLIESVQARNQK
ncbi:hypothetical protein FRC08_003175 [Ceratobasidium sp. 394]|nr:hypothetical protein FRC08_003175 [Ceratobasidium sp. 394]